MKNARWMDDAACQGMNLNTFFPDTPGLNPQIIQAKLACLNCPVKNDCLDHALKNNEHGIWGGTTEQQRKRLRREHRIPPPKRAPECGTQGGYKAHIRVPELPCAACRRAASQRRRELKQAKKETHQ